MGEFFGTDGIRGVAGEYPLDEKTVARIGYALARELSSAVGRAPQIIIGRDTRESGTWIERALAAGARAAGAEVISAGVITTPGVAFLTKRLNQDAGVVISASHNPYTDNGIKVFSPSGRKLSDATEAAIERDLKDAAAIFPPFVDAEVECDHKLKDLYLAFLRDEIGAGLDLRGLKLVIDCAEGASSEFAPPLFTALGAETISIHASPNGRNINLDCGSLHPEELQRRVVAESAALGFAFDGDADRMLLVDETGRLLDGDYVLYIIAEYLRAQGRLVGDRVVATVMSNLGLEVALGERGIDLIRASVGDKYVLEELLSGGGSLGGEQSGHIIFPEISLAGDGLITSLELLRVWRATKRSLSDLAAGFKRYPQVLINIRVARKPPLDGIPAIKEAIDALDREMNGHGRLLVRYSGTENLARVMLEGPDEAVVDRQARAIADLIESELGESQGASS
jgi:phosphoglucosamine mutase